MMHHYQGFTGFSQFFQNIDNGYFCGGIDPLKWFIHEINRGILYQSTRQKHPLLLTTAQLTDLPVFKGQHAYFFQDRKSTRLNSSHVAISYAVFCLKKKT